MMLFSTTPRLQGLLLSGWLFLAAFSHSALADNANVTLLQSQVSLSYPQEVRFSQLLSDAYAQLSYEVYPLGSALINPNKQAVVEAKKQAVLRQLAQLKTPAATHLAKQLNALRLVYHEDMVFDPIKVRIRTKLDPMIKGEYWLSLPKRPMHITVFDPALEQGLKMPLNNNADLRDYLAKLPYVTKEGQPYDSAWVIQADRTVYQARDLQWKNTLYFLSPGAMVFIGLPNLPDEYRDLNANIAHLLAFRLEL
ncbi:hypothetical protein HGG82_15835 [Marinomonas sp. M1K-6]|uniref:Capsule biosynthesis GfcC-like C-terminal domain-containing protein n=1 Tax=Marinomonas profundi TaxID=2726122 RepID=A0A847R9F0_9GAMM|nr:capsule biosynthesis GfcC D2 domain-containing protein [Marinomonas profundi]NLQ19073.1 hypothetical protein [Marinomonas profundi]UDV04218.1 capsule biosynthesis GfcC family protein [Marinomonas profundi]